MAINIEQEIQKLRTELSALTSNKAIYDNEVKKAFDKISVIFRLKERPTLEETMDIVSKLEKENEELSLKAEKLVSEVKTAMEKYNKAKEDI